MCVLQLQEDSSPNACRPALASGKLGSADGSVPVWLGLRVRGGQRCWIRTIICRVAFESASDANRLVHEEECQGRRTQGEPMPGI